MKQKQVAIHDLILSVSMELEKLGYRKYYVWGHYFVAMQTIENYHNTNGQKLYSSTLTAEFIKLTHQRYKDGKLSGPRRSILVKAAKHLDDFFLYGRIIHCKHDTYTPKPKLCDEFQCQLDMFMKSRTFNCTTARDFEWAIRKYLLFLQDRNYFHISDVAISDVRDFITSVATNYSASALINIQCYVRQFHVFLNDCGITTPDCLGLLSTHVPRHDKEKDCITDDELSKVLATIDTNTTLGKRNMAIVLLGMSTGLRAKDISLLKLSNIDWENGEIHLIQSNTNVEIQLPLTVDAGQAIQDYILNVRPQTDYSEVFLTSMAPFTPMASVSIRSMFDKYLRKAGVERTPFDGKTFHGLRRRIGHNMIDSGLPVTTVAQVLGHNSITVADKYFALSHDGLKRCALDFRHISVEGGDLIE